MKRLIYITLLFLASTTLCNCSEEGEKAQASQNVPVDFIFDTKACTNTNETEALDENPTISITLIEAVANGFATAEYGIYHNRPNAKGYLTSIEPLTPKNESYTLAIASTGKEISGSDFSTIRCVEKDVTGTTCVGFPLYRIETEAQPNLFLSGGVPVVIDGVSLNKSYVLDLKNAKLQKHTSRIFFKIKSITDITEENAYTIASVKVTDLIAKTYYCPMHAYHGNTNADIDADIALMNEGNETFKVNSTTAINIAPSATDYVNIISGDYSATYFDSETQSTEMLYHTPHVVVKIKNKNNSISTFTVPIKVNIKPLTEYTYTLTLASSILSVDVTAAEWGTSDTINGTVESVNSFEVALDINGSEDDGWNDPNGTGGTITGTID